MNIHIIIIITITIIAIFITIVYNTIIVRLSLNIAIATLVAVTRIGISFTCHKCYYECTYKHTNKTPINTLLKRQ